jgi:4-hydroxy-tetrahydrodipicolinate synthase
VIGLKETESVERITRIRQLTDVPIFSGDDGLTWPMIALGAVGVVSVASNVIPAEVSAMVRAALSGQMDAALAQHERLADVFRVIFLEPNPQPIKAACKGKGLLPDDDVRLPLVRCSDAVRAQVAEALAAL